MKQVWIVMAGYDYEGYEVVFVASSLEKAEKLEDAFKADRTNRKYDNWRIDCWDINDG